MPDKTPARPASPEDKYRTLLRIAAAVNEQLSFDGVLDAVARVVEPLVHFDLTAVMTIDGGLLRPHGVYVVDMPRHPGESFADTYARGLHLPADDVPKLRPLAGSAMADLATAGNAHVVDDLARGCRFPEDEMAFAHGIRAYVRAPLRVRDELIGSITFCRLEPIPFAPEEVQLLEDVSRPIATAVANSLAYEEIRRLRDQATAENRVLREEIDRESTFDGIVGSSPALVRVLERVAKVAATDTTVLVTGETGTGKELVARAIHKRSARASRALIKVNCAALPETLVASELFGHEKGSFTGAAQQRIGRFELAAGGTLFLDEIGELPASVQASLLRVLQDGEFDRVGGTRTLRTDARVIAATNRDLGTAVAEGRFRRDLYHRVNVFPIHVPALRHRRTDMPLLVESFVRHLSSRLGKTVRAIEPRTMEWFESYEWPGNVRELRNVIERAIVLADGDLLRIEEVETAGAREARTEGGMLGELRDQERRRIEEALAASHGRISGPRGAASRLGLPASTLEWKIRRLGIDKYSYRRPS